MGLSRRAFLLVPAALALTARSASGQPLWPGARYTEAQCKRAVRRGLEYLYRVASNPRHFQGHGDDLLWCFVSVSRATADEEIKQRAWTMGQERAAYWRRQNPKVRAGADATAIVSYAYASYAADLLGVPDDTMKANVQHAAKRYGPVDFLKYDPQAGPIPADVPQQCESCASENQRGQARCQNCRRPLKMNDPYDLLCDAMVTAYTGDSYGVTLGSSLADVMRIVPTMRPYDDPRKVSYERFASIAYAITHVIYVLNDYNVYRLRPDWLPQEFDYLKAHLQRTIVEQDAELTGEFLDSLKSFGLTLSDPIIRAGVQFVLSEQNADGSWGDSSTGDIYDLYHPTWTAVCGLMDYAWRGEGTGFPEALQRASGA